MGADEQVPTIGEAIADDRGKLRMSPDGGVSILWMLPSLRRKAADPLAATAFGWAWSARDRRASASGAGVSSASRNRTASVPGSATNPALRATETPALVCRCIRRSRSLRNGPTAATVSSFDPSSTTTANQPGWVWRRSNPDGRDPGSGVVGWNNDPDPDSGHVLNLLASQAVHTTVVKGGLTKPLAGWSVTLLYA